MGGAMPESSRKSIAKRRVQFTGERLEAARQGIARNKSLGLDDCTASQQEFRALLALGLFNTKRAKSAAAAWAIHYLTAYTIIVSPRWDRLVFIADAPDNVTNYVTRQENGISWIPGMRLEARHRNGGFVLRHIPTGAELVITSNRAGKADGKQEHHGWHSWTSVQLDDKDESLLAGIPSWGPDAQRILAGLAVRLSLRDPAGMWGIGNWFWDPLQRKERNDRPRGEERSLLGGGDIWELDWSGYPYQEDLVAALMHPEAGIHGAKCKSSGEGYTIFLGDARLVVRGPKI